MRIGDGSGVGKAFCGPHVIPHCCSNWFPQEQAGWLLVFYAWRIELQNGLYLTSVFADAMVKAWGCSTLPSSHSVTIVNFGEWEETSIGTQYSVSLAANDLGLCILNLDDDI